MDMKQKLEIFPDIKEVKSFKRLRAVDGHDENGKKIASMYKTRLAILAFVLKIKYITIHTSLRMIIKQNNA